MPRWAIYITLKERELFEHPDDTLRLHPYSTFISSESRLRKDDLTYTKMLLLRAGPTGQRRGDTSLGQGRHLHRDMYQLDKIADEAHNGEANCDCL